MIFPLQCSASRSLYMSRSRLPLHLRYSPISVIQISVITMKMPGIISIHHAPESIARCDSDIRLPHETTSEGSPSPRKLSVASIDMAPPILVTIMNITADMKFGIRCL